MHRILLVALAISACGGGGSRSNLARAVIDTLPGGILRVTSPSPTGWADSSGARLVEELRFQGEEGSPGELGDPRSMAVDEAGTIYIADTKPAVIKVFGPDGKFVRTFSREGEGPGEFRIGFLAARNGRLALHDPMVARTTLFDSAGTYLTSWRASCCYWSDIQLDRAGRIYVPSMSSPKPGDPPRGTPYVRWSQEGVALDTVWTPPGPTTKSWTVRVGEGNNRSMMSMSVPFSPVSQSTLHPDGGFVFGWNGAYTLVRSGTGADSMLVFGRSWAPDPIGDGRRQAEVESRVRASKDSYGEANLRAVFKVEDIPATFPAFQSLHVDESGRVWARRYAVSDSTRTTFDLFAGTGAWLGTVTAPFRVRDYGLQVYTKSGFVAIIEDEEGRPTVVRVRLDIRPSDD
ncbi:MAG: hypothetical protein HOP28_03540 [Gemmatimonadales bacterium]|nr:hypothetical protein [Gemmatimonadales bacterium]